MGRALAVSVVALGCVHTTGARPRPVEATHTAADVCRGSRLDVDAAFSVCTVHEAPRAVPVAALRVEILPSEIELEAGHEVSITVQMMNVTTDRLTLDLVVGCDAFETSTWAADGQRRVDPAETEECPRELPAGVSADVACRPGDPVRVTLEPGGRLVKRLMVAADSHRFARWRGACVSEYDSEVKPGRYLLRVRLPFPEWPSSVEAPMNVAKQRKWPMDVTGRAGG